MSGFEIEIPLLKLKESVITKYFDEDKESFLKLFICKECQAPIVFSSENLADHLRSHHQIWIDYLDDLADAISPDKQEEIRFDSLKLDTIIIDNETGTDFCLRLPFSRIQRDFESLKINEHLPGFFSRLQTQYNSCPVGQYAGPYDQNKTLPLSTQLPGTDLDFDQYTAFRHPDDVECKEFTITESYKYKDDLTKIDSLSIRNEEATSESDCDERKDDDEKMLYTCHKKLCSIPCPCAACNGEDQCSDHKIKHEKLFDVENDIVSIRSVDAFCTGRSFFEKSYLIKFPGIPIQCELCHKNYLHHICYHFDMHENCKFCRKGRYKTYATTAEEYEENVKNHKYYMKSVCPHCDRPFCETYFKKKHIEMEHEGVKRFNCDSCSKSFHSKQAQDYHYSVVHSKAHKKEKCNICGKEFSANVSLVEHIKYFHSDNREHSCPLCESRFKQKKDMRVHMLNIHGSNMSKERYGNLEGQERLKCDACGSTFKYKKGLNEHIRVKHETTSEPSTSKIFKCNQCSSVFTMQKNLTAHEKLKHSGVLDEFKCATCGKIFNQKKNLTRHEINHNTL